MNSLNVWSIFQFPVSQFDVIQSRYVLFICCHFQHRCHSFRTLWCHHKLHSRNYTFWSFLAFFFLVYICWEKVAFLDHFTSYRHRLDSVGPVHQNQQQIRLDIHICTSQPCCYKHDWLHKHLGTGIHLDLRIKGTKKFPHDIESNKKPDNGQALKKERHILQLEIEN